jgi:hypothetical protein
MARKVILILVLILISVLGLIPYFFLMHTSDKDHASEVYTWDCEYAESKPEAITFTCADGGQYVDGITWSSWGKDGAQGRGEYHVNTCDPNCAEGEFLSADVEVSLSDLTEYQGQNYLRTLSMKTLNGENLPESGQSTYEWDVMEFAEMMAE